MARVSLETLIRRSLDNMGAVHPAVKDKTLLILHKAYAENINVQVSSGLRTFEQQARLYAQGRTAPGNIVTNAEPGESVHNYGLAIDYFLTTWDGQQAVWMVDNDWRRVAEIGKSLGFTWGGDWSSFPDYPHLQLTDGLTWHDLKAGRRPAGELLNEGVPQKGHSGMEVYKIQQMLIDKGYDITSDGLFGPATDAAVRQFQRDSGLVVDGLCGPKTIAALASVQTQSYKEDEQMAQNKKDTGFTDVSKDDRFAEAVMWLKDEGIMEGYSDGSFGVDDNIKRQDFAVALYRALHK